MKGYEAVETARRFDVHLPIYARIDGRSFSRFTRGMARPFDIRMIDAMIDSNPEEIAKITGNADRLEYLRNTEAK